MYYEEIEMATVYVDVGLEQFDDDEIREEYEERGLGRLANSEPSMSTFEEAQVLTKIWIHDREGRKDEAYTLMREYVLNKLNKVV